MPFDAGPTTYDRYAVLGLKKAFCNTWAIQFFVRYISLVLYLQISLWSAMWSFVGRNRSL